MATPARRRLARRARGIEAIALVVPLLLSAAAAGAAQSLVPGEVVLLDQQFGFQPPNVYWAGLFMVDPDVDAAAEAPTFLLEDPADLPRSQAILPFNRDQVLVADTGADPSGLGPDPNPENQDADPNNDTGGPGAILLVDLPSETATVVSDGTRYSGSLPAGTSSIFVGPRDMLLLPDGDLLVVDPDADPSGFGFDLLGHAGDGALFRVELTSGEVSLVSDGSDYAGTIPDLDGDGQPDPSIFGDPWALAQNPADPDTVYVLDILADPKDMGYLGAVFQVDLADGKVSLLASEMEFEFLTDIAWKTSLDGLLLLDVRSPLPKILLLKPGSVTTWSTPSGVEFPVSAFTDASDTLYVVDSNANPFGLPRIVGPGALFVFDDADPDNPGVANSANDYFFLVDGAPVPTGQVPLVDDLGVGTVCSGVDLNLDITGSGFDPDATLATDPQVTILGSTWVNDTLIQASLEVACMASAGTHRVLVLNPNSTGSFGSFEVDPNLLGASPPVSAVGDINGDTVVDGLDLSFLGLSFGAVACCDPSFDNDADLNNDGVVNGDDLTVFAPSFGLRVAP